MLSFHLLVNQLDGYILQITTPDIQVLVENKEIFEGFTRLLQLKDEAINVCYDTTFCFGRFLRFHASVPAYNVQREAIHSYCLYDSCTQISKIP